MVLCDPVQRAQSAFYHFKSWGARFRQFVRRNAHMYGPMLDSWLAVVGDIMVVPSASYFDDPVGVQRRIVAFVQERSGVTVPSTAAHVQAPHANSHQHPALEADLTMADAPALKEMFASSNQHVYDLIAAGRVRKESDRRKQRASESERLPLLRDAFVCPRSARSGKLCA